MPSRDCYPPSGNTIYHLLPANLSKGEHNITLKMTNTGRSVRTAVTFHWEATAGGLALAA